MLFCNTDIMHVFCKTKKNSLKYVTYILFVFLQGLTNHGRLGRCAKYSLPPLHDICVLTFLFWARSLALFGQ